MNTHPTIMLTSWLSYVSIQISSQKAWIKKSFYGYNLAWLQKKCHMWDNWIQKGKHRGTFFIFTTNFSQFHSKPMVTINQHTNLDNLFYFFSLFLLFLFFFKCTHLCFSFYTISCCQITIEFTMILDTII